MSNGTLRLLCLVYPNDDPVRHVFEVNISNTTSVSILKDAIKAKKSPELDHLAADALKLWKVSILADGNLKQGLQCLKLVDGVNGVTELLPVPVCPLSSIFPNGVETTYLTIIVEDPSKGECGYFTIFFTLSDVSCGFCAHPIPFCVS